MQTVKVDVEITEPDKFTRSLAVEVPAGEVDGVRQEVIRELKARATMPGFRKGHVPADIVERQFADTIRERTVERVIEPAAREALGRVPEPAADPHVDELRYEPGGPLSFRLVVEVRPTVEVAGYKGLKVVREVNEIEDDDVDRAVDDLRRRVAQLAPAYRRAQEGDVVVVDIADVAVGAEPEASAIRRGLKLRLTPELASEPLGQALVGTIRGDERRVTGDAEAPDRELWVRVVDVTEEILPAADDAFFQRIGLGESTALARAHLRQILAEEEDRESLRAMAGRIVDQLLEQNSVELSPAQREAVRRLVAEEAERATGEKRTVDAAELEEHAIRELERETLLDSIAAQEKIAVAQEELDAEIGRIAQRARLAPDDVRKRLAADGRLASLRREILRGKVLGFLVEQASVRVDTKRREGRSRIILPGQAAARGGVIVPGR